jgi:hypothetical protein
MMGENYQVGIIAKPTAIKMGGDGVFTLLFRGNNASKIFNLNYYARKIYTFARFFRVEK